MRESSMAAQRLFVLESVPTQLTIDLLLKATVLRQYMSLGIRLLDEEFPTHWAAVYFSRLRKF